MRNNSCAFVLSTYTIRVITANNRNLQLCIIHRAAVRISSLRIENRNMADLLGSILGSMQKPPSLGDADKKKARGIAGVAEKYYKCRVIFFTQLTLVLGIVLCAFLRFNTSTPNPINHYHPGVLAQQFGWFRPWVISA